MTGAVIDGDAVVDDAVVDAATVVDRAVAAVLPAEVVAEAERTGRFPEAAIPGLGLHGVFTAKWRHGPNPDLDHLVVLARRLGGLGCAGIGVGVSLHDSAIAVLRRFGTNDRLRHLAGRAIRGEAVLCLAASEATGGSDLQQVGTVAEAVPGGWRVHGRKKFVSLSPLADVALVVARVVGGRRPTSAGDVALFAVPAAGFVVGRPYDKVGARSLSTAPIEIDAVVPDDALVARAGTGLVAVSWGLAHERLSIAGQVAGACDLALGVTVARLMRREQFGRRLIDHQALRLRVADLRARVDVLDLALDGYARRGRLDVRSAAAIKVTAARLGEQVIGECLHLFGGAGYLPDETPLGRWWQDMKLARIGGGTDEVLWEQVAAGLQPDFDTYERVVHET